MTSSENHHLAIMPYENPESPFILLDVILVDSFGVTHLACPLMVDSSTHGQNIRRKMIPIVREGEPKSTKEQVHNTHSDDENTLLVMMIPRQLRSRLRQVSRKYPKNPPSAPSTAIPVKVTRSVQRDLDASLLIRSTKKSHGIKQWQEQTIKDVLGKVDQAVIPPTSRGANSPVHRLKAVLTTKNEEIAALKVANSAALDQLHISYGLAHAGLVEENSRLEIELAKTQATLELEKSSNSVHLKTLVDMFAAGPSSSSVPPSVYIYLLWGKLGCITHMDTHAFCSMQYIFNIPGLNRFAIIQKGGICKKTKLKC